MTIAQGVVKNVDGKDPSSVDEAIKKVEDARAACDVAGRTTERDELVAAKNQLVAHADYLKRKASEPKTPKRTPEELASLVKHGDPGCPKGQAYKQTPTGPEVRCTGPELVDMSAKKVEEYFSGRGYKITKTTAPPTLKAEYGAELLVYTFAQTDDAPARCVAYYPPPGMNGLEAAARLTGVNPVKLEKAKTVRTANGEAPLRVEETEAKLVVSVGTCN
jgi:hypothetical protein